ncbi:DNA polymerase IV [PVC group bacterium]|nr:DNA polymerase IV [PVC group bacterium]
MLSSGKKARYIVHVDMDAFFAAVEQKDHPEYRGRPVMVGANPKDGLGRGVVSTCSYEARRFGIHSAMPITKAYQLCPHAIYLPVNFKRYNEESDKIFEIFERFTPDVEPISIDEAFLDITRTYRIFGTPQEVCRKIKETIYKETHLTASVGLAPIKMVAKIASDLDKPDGFVEVTSGGSKEFLAPLDIRKLWGLGPKGEKIFRKYGLNTIGDIAKQKTDFLERMIGSAGKHFWELANGIDDREVETSDEIKSIGNEITFDVDVSDGDEILSTIRKLADKVSSRVRDQGLKGKTVTLKIRLTGFETFTRASTLKEPTQFFDVILVEAEKLWKDFNKTKTKNVRLIGLRMSHFSESSEQMDFLDQADEKNKERRHKALDAVRRKHGKDAIRWAGTL